MPTPKSKLRFRIMAVRLPASKISGAVRRHRPFTAWMARADAAAPLGGSAVTKAVGGTPVAVMVQVRVRA